MKNKIFNKIFVIIITILVIFAIYNTYKCITEGNQSIRISTGDKAYTNSDLYVSFIVYDEDENEIDAKTKVTLLNKSRKKVKDVEVTYNESIATISIPNVDEGIYYIQAKVKSEAGTDTVEKQIYVYNGTAENVTISLDKGIYKPGDTVTFRALLTSEENDEPVEEEVNISIYDGNENKVYTENATTSSYGIVSGSFDLADELNSGIYKITVKTSTNETTKEFKVNPYVTPKYEVTLNYDKTTYLVGDTANITVNSEYFFGEPVTGAEFTVYINDEEYGTYTSDESGNATVEYEFKESGTYSIYVEAVDSSNYYVEESDSISVGTDIFEIELLPEYGTLVAGMKNNVYVFTKTADGTPVKTYVTITSDEFTKQIATDENGIGKFQIDVESLPTAANSNTSSKYGQWYYYSSQYNNLYSKDQEFSVVAENMEGEQVTKTESLSIETKALMVTTDNVKYEQGSDITVTLQGVEGKTKNIYFLKNDKVIKIVTTDSDEVTVNLDDNYGLIDIYVTEDLTSYLAKSSSSLTTYKRTIFINPEKELNISVSTDKEEYEPGENITISFSLTDETESSVDAALLVSMIDNQVLALAENDLSIDNIKLALSGISFSDGLDAATLYSCIVNDESEQTLMGLLLKQSDKDISVSEEVVSNEDEAEKETAIAIVLWAIVALILITYLCIKFKTFRKFLLNLLNIVILQLLIIIIAGAISDEFRTFRKIINNFSWWAWAIEFIIVLAIYIAGISRLYEKITRTSLSIFIGGLIGFVVVVLMELAYELDLEILTIIIPLILAIMLLVFAILSRVKKFQETTFAGKILKELFYILKLFLAFILALIIGNIIESIIDIESIGVPFGIVAIYIFNYLFNIREKNKKSKSKKENHLTEEEYYEKLRKNNIVISIAVIAIIIGVVIAVLALGIMIYNNAKETVSSADLSSAELDTSSSGGSSKSSGSSSSSSSSGAISTDTSTAYTDSSSSEDSWISDAFSSAYDYLTKNSDNDNDYAEESVEVATTNTEEVENAGESSSSTEETIRSVFLESMCFIPELITENGEAKLELTLSDNITTWTIQTVGNTKDGKIGYGIIDNVKVSKDYFIDFDLPNNLVVGDTVSIPVTVYNYTENAITSTLNVQTASWFTINGESSYTVETAANSTTLQYISITITESGDNKFRVEGKNDSYSDIVEKTASVNPNGYKVEQVVSTGILSEDVEEDILILEDTVENTAKATVKIYSSAIAQTIEGMENIFKMPTGCFEQISSTLYPNVLALKYLEDTGTANDTVKETALKYISSGYQKLLTYEVSGEKGGYSLYGKGKASTVLTAYGLMELTDLSEVYSVDETVLEDMEEFLYGKQNSDGSFEITGSTYFDNYVKGQDSYALNAYIIWALSESDPKDTRLEKSVSYLKDKLDDITSNYTLALIANVLVNVDDDEAKEVMKKLANNTTVDSNKAYLTSSGTDYYGTKSKYQNIQTTALASMAFSKAGYNTTTNNMYINYIISQKDTKGTWYTTQATVFALKAINELNENTKLENQTIKVTVNNQTKEIVIGDDPLSIYTVAFDDLSKENKLEIEFDEGKAYYEVIEEYYVPWDSVTLDDEKIEVSVTANTEFSVNDELSADIKIINNSSSDIMNGMVTISIPQGFVVDEDSLLLLETNGLIEKYETSYTEVNLYLQDFEESEILNLNVKFRASYPVQITGLSIRVYDYYNPEVEGISKPIEIKVNE